MMIESKGKSGIDTGEDWVMLCINAMPAPTPLISVIIVCRNPGPRLRVALTSVWAQQKADYEIVIVDGASMDGTREWLETQTQRIAVFISEPDGGVYDAMNKGIALAKGEWLLFLGADDCLEDGIISKISAVLRQTTAGILSGVAMYDDGRIYGPGALRTAIRRNFLHHQATFYRRALFGAHGNFQTNLQIMGDYEFNLRLVRANVGLERWLQRVATCGTGGVSDGGGWAVYREEIQVRHQYFSGWRCWGWDLVSILRYGRKKIVRCFASV